MRHHIFREYDIRGIVHEDFFIEDVYSFGLAFGQFCREKNPYTKTIAIGMDGRIHSAEIKDQLCKALYDSGFDVYFIGLCPTPVLYFTLHTEPIDAGIMITASHNGPEYNGFKLSFGKESLSKNDLQKIYQLLINKPGLTTSISGSLLDYPMIEKYTKWLVQHFSQLKNSCLKMAIDCGNGATAAVLPLLCDQLNWSNAQLIFDTIDGNFPQRSPDPTQPASLHELQRHSLSRALGFAFDGDGDRMVVVSPKGNIILGDTLLALLSKQILQQHPNRSVVFDIKCSSMVQTIVQSSGGTAIMAPTGHFFIKQYMKKCNAVLGGELSCHFFFGDRYFGYDDGIYAMLRLVELLQISGRSLLDFLDELPTLYTTPELRIECLEDQKMAIMSSIKNYFLKDSSVHINTMDGVLVTTKHGRGIIRPSHTQAVICVRCESPTKDGLHFLTQEFYRALHHSFDAQHLDHYFNFL